MSSRTHQSLEALGNEFSKAIATFDLAKGGEISTEIIRRCEFDDSKIDCLLDYHLVVFKRHPSTKHWSELIAMMGAKQAKAMEGTNR